MNCSLCHRDHINNEKKERSRGKSSSSSNTVTIESHQSCFCSPLCQNICCFVSCPTNTRSTHKTLTSGDATCARCCAGYAPPPSLHRLHIISPRPHTVRPTRTTWHIDISMCCVCWSGSGGFCSKGRRRKEKAKYLDYKFSTTSTHSTTYVLLCPVRLAHLNFYALCVGRGFPLEKETSFDWTSTLLKKARKGKVS